MNRASSSPGTAPLGAAKPPWHLAIDSMLKMHCLPFGIMAGRNKNGRHSTSRFGGRLESTAAAGAEAIRKQPPGMCSNPIWTSVSPLLLLHHHGDLESRGRKSSLPDKETRRAYSWRIRRHASRKELAHSQHQQDRSRLAPPTAARTRRQLPPPRHHASQRHEGTDRHEGIDKPSSKPSTTPTATLYKGRPAS